MMVSPTPNENVYPIDVFENHALLVSSPHRADEDLADISFAAEATDDLTMDYSDPIPEEDEDNSFDANNSNSNSNNPKRRRSNIKQPLKTVEIEKTASGFGFNIVGGIDNPHFPGDIGIYISAVNPTSKSYGIVQQGDKILSFNGADMSYKTHDEAVAIFRTVKVGHVAKMMIDREYLTLEDRTQTPSSFATTSSVSYREGGRRLSAGRSGSVPSSETGGKGVRLQPHGVAAIVERLRGKISYEDEDAQSVASYAPSTHSIIDDVPRTPRKPMSILDPRNDSWFTEALYLSIGIGALSLSGYLVYRFIRGRH